MVYIKYYNYTVFKQKQTKYEKYGKKFYPHAEMIVSTTCVQPNMAFDMK